MQELLIAVTFIAVLVASYTDIKKHEVADWVNYGLAAFGIGVNALLSIAFWNASFIVFSILGLAVFFGIAYAMFYAGQWGGGDSKMLIAIGAVFGLPVSLSFPFLLTDSFLVSFWFNLLLAGVAYALLWSVFLAAANRRKFTREFSSLLRKKKNTVRLALAASAVVIFSALLSGDDGARLLLLVAAMLLIVSVPISVFSKAVERAAMLKLVPPSRLTEGDWIAKDVVVNRKTVAGPKDLGVSKKQIARLKRLYSQKKIRKVVLKTGVPFVPSFLAAFIMTVLHGNALFALLRII